MAKFTHYQGIIAPLAIANIDTDAIIPKQFLQTITRDGLGEHLFHEWRFTDNDGREANPAFILNQAPYQHASILLAQENFGCGSSREHAPWALLDYGIRIVIAPSFADIFYGNALNNHLLPIRLTQGEIDSIFACCAENDGITANIDIEAQTVTVGDACFHFELDAFRKHCLINKLDNIGLTLQHSDAITEFENRIPEFLR